MLSNEASAEETTIAVKRLFGNLYKYIDYLEKYVNKKKKKKQSKSSLCSFMYYKFKRTISLIISLLFIAFSYYMFTFWHLIPNLESTQIGLDLRFLDNIDNKLIEKDTPYRSAYFQLVVFHILFFIFIVCLIHTMLKNPGYIPEDYVSY